MTELLGVCLGALIVLISTSVNNAYINRKIMKQNEIDEKMKEVDILLLLNDKVNEILQKRNIHLDNMVSFDRFDDCFITIDDYVYIQSFCAQNYFYLPNYLVEEFFKNIAHRQIVYSPDEVNRLGAYTYKGGRIVIENFSEELIKCVEDRKIELKQIRQKKISYLHK